MMCIVLQQLLLLLAIVSLIINCNVEAKLVKLENYSDTFGLRKSALNQQKKQIETTSSNLSASRPSSDSVSSASELQNLMNMPSGRRRFDDVAPSASIETSRHQSLSPAINGFDIESRQSSGQLNGIELRQKLLAADMLLNSNIGRQFEQQLKSTTNSRFNQHLAQSNTLHLQKKRSSSQQQELPIQSSDDKDNLDELDDSDENENVDEDDENEEERRKKAQSRSSNDRQDDEDNENENDNNDEFSEPQARISDTFFQDNDDSVNAKLNSRSSYDDNDNDDEITETTDNNNKMRQPQTNKNNLKKQETKNSKSLHVMPNEAHSAEIGSNEQNSLDDDETADRDSNYDASNISLNKTHLTKQKHHIIKNHAIAETFAASQAQVNKAGASDGADLTAAAGHHHHHGHSHYYQYVEVPKKKAWKFGFKRGNHKHESEYII